MTLIGLFRKKTEGEDSKIPIFTCDDHKFRSNKPNEIMNHLKSHEGKVSFFRCEAHKFGSDDRDEIFNHLKSHAQTLGVPYAVK